MSENGHQINAVERLFAADDHLAAAVEELLPAPTRERLRELQAKGHQVVTVIFGHHVIVRAVLEGFALTEMFFTADGERGARVHGFSEDADREVPPADAGA
ncbi:hypothetical protein [Paraburkholderia aspalathi]|uniref:hypothetical protein n=1 Tax=Paraburkholderia aspalathi TaxID=1324617 RepID=UPI001B0DFF17|nr:hypothetical protein [Paraburkholderia aspalathi]CAE6846065.1 hypothetical protein R20943_07346 [Paraburkholderia aspalathi]